MSHRVIRNRTLCTGIATLLATVLLELPAIADDTLAETVRACAAVRTDAERLACFDRSVVPAASGAETAAASPSQEEMFGMGSGVEGAQAEAPPPTAAEPEPIDEISAQVASLQTMTRGERVIALDNGQVWQTPVSCCSSPAIP